MRETDLNDVLLEVLDSLRISLEERQVEVRVPHRLPVVVCDAVRIGEVFRNLITNAMKYNDKPDKWIEIGMMSAHDAADRAQDVEEKPMTGMCPVFYVRDNGIGIRAKHLDAVFRIFKRLHGRDKFGGGTGAGLTIVKKIVQRHGGRVWVESTHGQGTTFFFTLRESEQRPYVHQARPAHAGH